MTCLEVNNLTVYFDNKDIINNISFSACQNDWLMLIGPNGAGKSTLINAISQNLKYEGDVTIDSNNLKQLKQIDLAKIIGVFSQNNIVSQPFTVRYVVSMGRFCYKKNFLAGLSKQDVLVIDSAISQCGLDQLSNRSVTSLSGGELQRVFLAQVLAQDPKVLLLDEPTNHLDLKYQKQIFDIIDKWRQLPNKIVISAMHDLAGAKYYGTKALLLSSGKNVAYGSIKSVFKPNYLQKSFGLDVVSYIQTINNEFGK